MSINQMIANTGNRPNNGANRLVQLFQLSEQQKNNTFQKNRLLAQDKVEADSREKLSIAEGALIGKQLLAAGNIDGAKQHFAGRVQEIKERGGDFSHSLNALNMLESGDIEGLNQGLDSVISVAERTGVLSVPADSRTASQKDFQFATQNGFKGTFEEFVKSKTPSTSTTVINEADQKGLTEEQKALAKSRVTRFESIKDQADNAITQDEQLAQLENIDISTGFGTEARGAVASVINAFVPGAGDELLNTNVDALQAFRGVSSRLVNSELNKAKGPQTDGDAKRAKNTLANLNNQNLANKFLIQSLRATNARWAEQAEFYENVLERDGSLKKADREWLEFKRKTPMLSDSVKDAETGLPMFYRDFKMKALEKNPGASDEQILEAWRGMQ